MKVLVIQPKIGMGDMIIYLPYIHAISQKYQSPISLLVKNNSRAKELLDDDEHIDEIIPLDRTKDKSGSHDGVKGFFKLAKEIKNKKFDRIFIFNGSLRFFLIAKIAGIKNISQYPLFQKKDNIYMSAKIFIEQELNIIVPTQPILKLKKDKVMQAKNKFENDFKHICLGVSASGPTKRWGINNYIKLCQKINSKFPCKFYLAGGNNDLDLISKIFKSEIGPECFSFTNLMQKKYATTLYHFQYINYNFL